MWNPSLFSNVIRKSRVWYFWLLVFALFGCSEQTSKDQIRFGLTTDPVTLDPRYATDAVSDRINRLIYTRLVDFDENFRPIPMLARWERISDRHYRFVLGSQYREFHDGTHLTSNDVRATYEAVLDPATASPHRGSLDMINWITTPDPETIDFHLNRADPLFPGRLTMGIMPAHLLELGHPFGHHPVGSGPLKLLGWPQSGNLKLQRVKDHQHVEFRTVNDPTVRILKLIRGEIDLFQGDIPQEMLDWLEKQPEVVVLRGKGNVFSYLGFNLQDPVTGQLEVRQAIAYAIDRDAIIRYIFKGSARKANAILPPEHWAGDPELTGYRYNPATAEKLLLRLGYDRAHPLKITFKTSNNPFRIRLATVIQSQLKQVGIDMEIQGYDWGTFYGDIKAGHFQMYSLSWVGLKLPDIFRYVFHSASVPPTGANRGRYTDPVTDRLIEMAEAELQPGRQAALYKKIQQRLLGQLPYVPLWYEDNLLLKRKELQGYTLASDGNYDGLLTTKKKGND